MDLSKILLATLGGAFVFFLLGWIIWGFALYGIHEANTITYEGLQKEYPDLILIAVSMVFQALLYSIIFNRWAGISTFASGAKAGALIAGLSGFGYSLMMMASMNLINFTVAGTDLFGNLLWGAIGGGVIGWILGRGKS